ncbi:MAG: ABC transporter permease subunit [Deltaproteobacteria bacterium]|jgi:molybdate transport system permease protein|nr:ABC transporter permease subunit [Deltaproteobacteria bacterium]MBT4262966.1 ABC transporter permease subunit [Deltaproteobacteria bacterium]MBT4644547.1 ABC transporter permease subunit [Deltaproteobacteria bacterium]MBT6501442.1 ABC transporter permease subunit [Deltaproteobacteria bacterium]MBT6616092.1 ABC transporter permease subunit [Deltaproteobacteria bacterium]
MKISRVSLVISLLFLMFLAGVFAGGLLSVDQSAISALLADPSFFSAVLFSLKTSLLATLIAFIVGVPAGFYLARVKGRLARLLDVLFDIPIVIPPLISGVLLLTFFNQPLIKAIYPFIFSTVGAVIAQFFVAVPFTIKSAKTAFTLVPPIYERIAMTLGARPMASFFDTTFKIALPGISSGLVLTWLRCMGEFGATLMVGGGIPGKTANIPINVYLHLSGGDLKLGIAISLLTVLLVILCIFLINSVLFRFRGNQKLVLWCKTTLASFSSKIRSET